MSGATEPAFAAHQLQGLQLFKNCHASMQYAIRQDWLFSFILILGIGIKNVHIFVRKY